MMSRRIRLDDLAAEVPALTEDGAAFYRENCVVALDAHAHTSGVRASVVVDDIVDEVAVEWRGSVTDHARRSYRQQDSRTDFAACAIALLLMPEFTGFRGVLPSAKGNGIDYYLSSDNDDELIFNHAAVLEVSGIHQENRGNTVDGRIAEKKRRLKRYAASLTASTEDLPTYICVVESSQPRAKVVLA